jgi:purine-binding chemotaxis protein CheW
MNEVLVLVELAGQQYALPVRQVREVLPRAALTALPGAPAGVLGVLSLRGVLLPVLDLRQRLGLPAVPASIGQRIVAVELPSATIGLLVDAVTGIVAGPADVASGARESSDEVVRRVAEIDGQVVSVLETRAAVGAGLAAYVAAIAPPAASSAPSGDVRALPGQAVSEAT